MSFEGMNLELASRVPIRDGLLAGDLARLESVRLAGCRCSNCNEVSFGAKQTCPNCGGNTVSNIALGNLGTLWTYTVVRGRPPGDYKGPDPFEPFGLGLVELPEGVRVLAPLDADIASLHVGLKLRLRAFVQHSDAEGREVVAFSFTARN